MKTKERKKKVKTKRSTRWILAVILCLALLAVLVPMGMNAVVVGTTAGRILSEQEAGLLEDVDCILVLGCGLKNDGSPSDMLHDRLTRGVALFQAEAAPKLLMSGDHGRHTYNEVQAMKEFAKAEGIASGDIFMDHAGFSTYESLYRAKEIFCAKKVIIVTQQYHLYRALYIAQALGIEAYGVPSNYRNYQQPVSREVREVLARCKDMAFTFFKPEPTYLGETIPISGDGDLTND